MTAMLAAMGGIEDRIGPYLCQRNASDVAGRGPATGCPCRAARRTCSANRAGATPGRRACGEPLG